MKIIHSAKYHDNEIKDLNFYFNNLSSDVYLSFDKVQTDDMSINLNNLDSVIKNQTDGKSNDLYEIPLSVTILLSFLYIVVSLIAVFGNSMVFYIVLMSKRMRNVTNLFIANLALADILIGSLAIPFQFTAALLQRWILPSFLCSVCPTVQVISLNVSIFTLTAISIDRWWVVTSPFKNKLTKSKANIIIIFIWLISLLLALPTFLSWNLRYIPINKDNQIDYYNNNRNDQNLSNYSNQSSSLNLFNSENSNSSIDLINRTVPFCDVDSSLISDNLRSYYHHILVFVQFFLPLFIISYCYIHMAIRLNSEDLSTNARNDCARALQVKRRVIKMLFVVVALFGLCWLPFQLYNILQEIYPSINEYRFINLIFFACHFLAMSNSCYNVFIYAIYSERFKTEFQNNFIICCFWTKFFEHTRDYYSGQDYNTVDMTIHDKQNLRIGSLRSQTQYSDISFEKRSPKTTLRLSIKQSNGKSIQTNSSPIKLNGLNKDKNNLDENRNLLNCNNNNNKSQSSLSSKSSFTSLNNRSIQLNNELKKDNNQINTKINDAYKLDNSITLTNNNLKKNSLTNQSKYPKLEKLIKVEIEKLETKKIVSKKLIRSNTAIEIDDHKKSNKIIQNHKLFSESVS